MEVRWPQMNELQLAGLIVVSTMSVLLFWRMICIEQIEKSLQLFFISLFETLWTLFEMVGFYFGLGWSALIFCYLYTMSGFHHKTSFDEWTKCVEVSGILSLIAFFSSLPFLRQDVVGWIVGLYSVATIISVAIYCNTEYSVWED